MRFARFPIAEAEGVILAHSLHAESLRLKKGTVLDAAMLQRLQEAGIAEVTGARLEAGDVGEDEAAARLGKLLEGHGLQASAASTGRVNLHADFDGVLSLDAERINRLNRLDESFGIGTLPAFARVRRRQIVATVKIMPFAIPGALLEQAEVVAAESSALAAIQPFRLRHAALIQTALTGVKPPVLDKTLDITRARLDGLGMRLTQEWRCQHDEAELAVAIGEAMATEPDLLLITGASAITDRGDTVPAAIEQAGGAIRHFGMPVDPGNLLLLAEIAGTPVLGLPGCARSPKTNGLDWVLERLAAKLPVSGDDIMGMGVGGLLVDAPERPQPRRNASKPGEKPVIDAVLLAAGRSQRFGPENKLLANLSGSSVLRRSVENALAADCFRELIVVTGHEDAKVRELLDGLACRVVHASDYREGLSTSLKAGVRALQGSADAFAVLLGDMPLVKPETLAAITASYDPGADALICYPTHEGQRGNPMLFDRRFIVDIMALSGDIGARHLLSEHGDYARAVSVNDAGVLLDLDTPEALSAAVINAGSG